MADPLTIGMISLQGASTIAGAFSGRSAKKKSRKLRKLNTQFIRDETAESARRMSMGHEQQLGLATAMTGASGVQAGTGSAQLYLDAMKSEQSKELAWLQKAGESRAKIARKGGQMNESAMQRSTVGNFFSGAQSTWSMGNKYNWGKD